ncbi:hypothetical protein EKO04_003469 [Ascochyta lentis]|uniref:Uncharacterized protein n=1 Tax=Ascochyta lentis TaxID=205686 RepID=A0A8H7J5D9_9PLEO|nr:hypothetical protein EKO04_003469 [Ascochyta lentis]
MQTDTIPSGTSTKYFWFFLAVFGLRYIRVISNIIGNVVYRPSCVAWKPKYDASDVTVMIPTMGLNSELLHQVVKSILLHPIAKLIIVTNGPDFEDNCSSFRDVIADPRISHLDCENKGRRHKTALALPHVHTPLVILQDNKSTWPKSPSFIPLMIAPFEDSQMGAVTPAIEAQHHHHRNIIKAFYNFLGMTYLVRRCHEYKACNAIDGGLSTLPGRFGLFRTSIYASKEFQQAYLNEYCWVPFYGLRGPLDADDDKFHTRWLIEHGWKMKIQALPETTLMTENGELDRFYNQVLRWTRTTWRSNPKELSHAKVWRRHPFTSITLLLWMVRMSLIYEVLLFWLLYKSCQGKSSAGKSQGFAVEAGLLALWIVALKFNKISPHFVRHPKDLVFFAPYILFGWYCSLVKIWAGLTCWNISWEVAKPAATNEHTEGTHVSDNAKDAETSSVD